LDNGDHFLDPIFGVGFGQGRDERHGLVEVGPIAFRDGQVCFELPPKNWTGGEGAVKPAFLTKEAWYNAWNETSA
jgi:hypothetical protein